MHKYWQKLIISNSMEGQQSIDEKVYVRLPVEDLALIVSRRLE